MYNKPTSPELLPMPKADPTPVPFAVPYFRRRRIGPRTAGGFYPHQVAAAYQFPRVSPPSKAPLIAILELGGGYAPSDVSTAMQAMNLPVPTITSVSVQGAGNAPGDAADAEVALDIQVAAGAYSACTGSPASILMVWCPNTSAAFAAGIRAAADAGAAVCSISWGAPENVWAAADKAAMEAAISYALSRGCAVFAAAGDNDAGDGESGLNVDYPASSPGTIGCGGTTLTVAGTSLVEKVWNDNRGDGTGGGYSVAFAKPAYQSTAHPKSSRGVPDVAGNADPATGYLICLNGQWGVIGGTSAVSPLWSGLVAACVAGGANSGDIHATLYANPSAFRDIVSGDNAGYSARPGWDETTGLGTPVGEKIYTALRGGVTPPPPPPVQPPPVLPPLPPVGPTLQQVLSADEDVFARLQTVFARVYGAAHVLNTAKLLLEQEHAALWRQN